MNFPELGLGEWFSVLSKWISGIRDWYSIEGLATILAAALVGIYLLLNIAKILISSAVSVSEQWKKLEIFRSGEERDYIRRRRQFCGVLLSDLATLAKAENWNDQYFTDLEAEVEAEGGYYANGVDRLLGRISHGLRRVPSLIQAIESSTEQCFLVTGDPGSGKSVAMRHLANALAEDTKKSKKMAGRIPLYINLKELPPPPPEGPTADFIRAFVIDNIRRGDADTAAYVRNNWDSHRDQGHWFFLLDSFDEIPSILHAPSESPTIRQHSHAIRQFLEGMSSCKGVLASREFKGPNILVWTKFRILPLSIDRQEQLINNSFLTRKERQIVSHHVAGSGQGQGFLANPLFLALLCRFVHEERAIPVNDSEILLRHIKKLSYREPEFIERRYGISPAGLLEGSIQLASLFAEDESLSLGPTRDEIVRALGGAALPAHVDNLLAALIEVKIGRCDVKEALPGDRRFTFSHRRYQEILFVEHLRRNPSHLPPRELLTNHRWREYVVTLLQTGSSPLAEQLLSVAADLLAEPSERLKKVEILPEFGVESFYFEWDRSAGPHLLQLLQDGLGGSLESVPDTLREKVGQFLSEPWNNGDLYDRRKVLALGGLLPTSQLRDHLLWVTTKSATTWHMRAAFSNSYFLRDIEPESRVANWLRKSLSDYLLGSENRSEFERIVAIGRKIPREIGASWIIERARSLYPFSSLFDDVLSASRLGPSLRRRLTFLMFCYCLVGGSIMIISRWVDFRYRVLATIVTFPLLVLALWRGIQYAFRSVGSPLSFYSIYVALPVRKSFLFMLLIGSLLGLGAFLARVLEGTRYESMIFPLCNLLIVIIMLAVGSVRTLRRRRSDARLRNIARGWHKGKTDVFRYATDWRELSVWIRSDLDKILPTWETRRSFLRTLSELNGKYDSLDALAHLGPLKDVLAARLREDLLQELHEG